MKILGIIVGVLVLLVVAAFVGVPTPVGYLKIWPYSSERSPAISGTLLDERTRTPVAGAEVFFTYSPQLHTKSDKDGNFKIRATQNHYWITAYGPGGESRSYDPPLSCEITITDRNWATRKIQWDKSPQTLFLQKLPEPSDVRPWMTFDGSGVILEDGGAMRYLAPGPVQTTPGFARGPIYFGPYRDGMHRAAYITNGALCVINVNFAQRVFDPHLTVSRGPNKPSFPGTAEPGFSWSFWPGYDRPSNLIRAEDTSYVYKLEFIR
jgi:hypothetical protein